MPEHKLNILVIPSWYPSKDREGHGIFIRKHVDEIARRCKVTVLYFDLIESVKEANNLYYIKREVIHSNLEQITVEIKFNGNIFNKLNGILFIYWFYFKNFIIRKIVNYDIIHLNVPYSIGVLLSPFILLSRKPLVITEHWSGYFKEDYRFWRLNFFTRFLIKKLFQKASVVTVVSKALGESINSIFKIENKIRVINNVILLVDSPRPLLSSFEVLKPFLFIGSFNNAEKGLTGIIDAFSIALKQRNDISLKLAGDGQDMILIINLVNRLNLGNHVQFLGFVKPDQIPALYKQSACYILNSNFETFSISAAEALMWGVPVISTRCKGPEEYINVENGILIDPGNTNQLSEAILLMAKNYNTYSPQRVHDSVIKTFSIDISRQFYDLYEGLYALK